MKSSLTLVFSILLACGLMAQQPPHCGTDEFTEILVNNNPELKEKYAGAQAMLATKAQQLANQPESQLPVYTIPVVVHVIYNSQYDNISRSQILDALRVLNEDFRRQNADKVNTRAIFQARAADVEVEFALAKIDPSGNCTDGINRVNSALSVNASDNVKDLIHWNNDKYMNVWVVNSINSSSASGTILGYAYRPFIGQGYKQDGLVIRHDRMGIIGTGVSEGRTLTHEAGHYLGLLHPFDNGCNGGDNISDTPPVAISSFGCNFNKNTCHGDSPDLPDMIENYMDYADDNCQNAFTFGQKNVMRAALQTVNIRQELRLQSNLQSTGVINPPACQPKALVRTVDRAVCPGDTITFRDETENGDATSWKWNLPGATPSVSTDQNPTVIYNGPGIYDVSLTVSNSIGSDSVFVKDYVKVRPFYTNFSGQWIQDFEAPLQIPTETTISQLDSTKFRITNLASTSGTQSLFLDNFNAQAPGAVDEYISPHIFTIFSQDLILTFDYAFSAFEAGNTDQLRVMVSDDCGETWSLRKLLSGGILRTTTTFSPNPFVPTPSEWSSTLVPLLFYDNGGPILIKFEFSSGGGNNLYIDNINLSGSNVGLEEKPLAQRLSIFPNPATDAVHIQLGGLSKGEAEMALSDLSGKKLRQASFGKNATQHTLQRDGLPAGVYFLTVKEGGQSSTHKIIFE